MGSKEKVESDRCTVKESPGLDRTNAVCDAQLVLPRPTDPRSRQRGAHRRSSECKLCDISSGYKYFLRGHSVSLTSGVGGERSPVSKYTVGAVASMGPGLVRLHLVEFDKMTDQSFAAVISRHPALEDLSLRY
jgi:hypothetical protein